MGHRENPMTKIRTTLRLSLVIERIEDSSYPPSSPSPFPAARKVVDTTGVEFRDSELPPSCPSMRAAGAVVIPFAARRVG